MEDIAKLAVNCNAADNAISWAPDMLIEFQVFAENIVGFLLNKTTLEAPVTKLVRRHAELAVINDANFYNSCTNDLKEKPKRRHCLCHYRKDLLLRRHYSNITTRRKQWKGRKPPILLDSHTTGVVRANVVQKTTNSNLKIKVQNVSLCYGR